MFSKKKKEKFNINISIRVNKDGNVDVIYPTDEDVNFSFTLNGSDYFGPDYNICRDNLTGTLTIPVNGLNQKMAQKSISNLMADYREEIDWCKEYKFTVNGKEYTRNIPFNKEIWFCS